MRILLIYFNKVDFKTFIQTNIPVVNVNHSWSVIRSYPQLYLLHSNVSFINHSVYLLNVHKGGEDTRAMFISIPYRVFKAAASSWHTARFHTTTRQQAKCLTFKIRFEHKIRQVYMGACVTIGPGVRRYLPPYLFKTVRRGGVSPPL